MTGLLLKDWYNLRQQGKVYLLIIGLWTLLSISNKDAAFLGSVMMMLTILVPISSFAYDEQAKWDRYALTMPVTRKNLVASKYVLAMLGAFFGSAYSSLAGYFIDKTAPVLLLNGAFFALGLSFSALTLPFMFKYGPEKGRLIMIAVVLVPTLLVSVLGDMWIPSIDGQALMALLPFAPLAAVLVVAVSFFISCSIYEKKEF